MAIRILLADDHTLFRQGLRRILDEQPEFDIVGEAASGLEAIELARRTKPDVAILDIAMKGINGLEATSQILQHSPKTAVLILSMHSDERYVIRAVRAGARGYILKDSVEEGLIRAIQRLQRGQPFFSPEVVRAWERARRLRNQEPDDRYELLTERERQLYHLLVEGKSNKEIASLLGLSLHTVETHRTRIMDKLNLHGFAQLIMDAVRRGDLLPD